MESVIAVDSGTSAAVADLVRGGAYSSPEAVVRAGVALVEERQRLRREAFERELAPAIRQAEQGDVVSIEEAFAFLEEEIAKAVATRDR